jgi:hypothetical protein
MAYRLGRVLYWTCLVATAGWLVLVWWMAKDPYLGYSPIELGFLAAVPSVLLYGLGRAFRYVLSGEGVGDLTAAQNVVRRSTSARNSVRGGCGWFLHARSDRFGIRPQRGREAVLQRQNRPTLCDAAEALSLR